MVEFDHPVWRAAAATVGGYGLLLAVLTLLLFVIPFLVFARL